MAAATRAAPLCAGKPSPWPCPRPRPPLEEGAVNGSGQSGQVERTKLYLQTASGVYRQPPPAGHRNIPRLN